MTGLQIVVYAIIALGLALTLYIALTTRGPDA